ncbi:MAG TPA: hypothetical protein VF532_10715 [Candidatus Angelobacter sp.]
MHVLLAETFATISNSGPEPPAWVTSYILPIAGALVIIGAIALALWLPTGNVFNRAQKFEGFGVKLEVTVLTLLIVVGVGMLASGFILKYVDDNIGKLKTDLDLANMKLHDAEHVTATIALALPDKMEKGLEPASVGYKKIVPNLICTYKIGDDTRTTAVYQGDKGTLQISIPDLRRNDVIRDLEISSSSKDSPRLEDVLATHNLYPLVPQFSLAQEKANVSK